MAKAPKRIEGAPIDMAANAAKLQAMTKTRQDAANDPVVEVGETGPIHRSSVLGYTLYSMGFDPQQDGELVLDVTATGISRILTGARPTTLALMRRLEPLVDALQRNPAYLPDRLYTDGATVPWLCNARDWLKDDPDVRMRAIGRADQSMLTHPSKLTRVASMLGFHEAFDALEHDTRDDWPQDAAGMFGACCRIVGWSALDAADGLGIGVNQARRLIDGRDAAKPDQWHRLFRQYDLEVADQASPIGVGIRWARAAKPRTRSSVGADGGHLLRRSDIEEIYAIGDGVPVLFADDEGNEENEA